MGEAIVEKSYVYTCLHDIFAELTIDYKEEFCRYLRINTASYQVRFVQKNYIFIEKLKNAKET